MRWIIHVLVRQQTLFSPNQMIKLPTSYPSFYTLHNGAHIRTISLDSLDVCCFQRILKIFSQFLGVSSRYSEFSVEGLIFPIYNLVHVVQSSVVCFFIKRENLEVYYRNSIYNVIWTCDSITHQKKIENWLERKHTQYSIRENIKRNVICTLENIRKLNKTLVIKRWNWNSCKNLAKIFNV